MVMAKKNKITWRLQTYANAALAETVIKPQVEAFNKAANGEMEIELYTASEIVPEPELFRAVQDGTVDAAQSDDKSMGSPADVADFSGYFPLASRYGLDVPTLWNEYKLNDIWKEAYSEIDGVEWLATGGWDPCIIATSTPIRSIDDFKGLKLYMTGTLAQFMKRLHAVPVTVANEDVSMGLQTGELDGVAWSGFTELYNIGWADIAKYALTNPLSGGWAGSYFVNSDSWKKIPDHLKTLYRMSIAQSNYHRLHWYWYGEAHYRAKGGKMKLTSIPSDQWSTVEDEAKKFWDETAQRSKRNARVVEILKDYLDVMRQAGAPYRG